MKLRNKTSRRNRIEVDRPRRKSSSRYVLLGLIVVFIFFSVFITIQGVTTGNDLTDLERQAEELSNENKKLSEKLIASSSLRDKVSVAKEFGFQKPSEIIYLDGEVSVAALR